jgi:hypothetical protein
MKTSYTSAIVLVVSALASGYATASNQGGSGPHFPEADTTAPSVSTKTRAEVSAELEEAQRTGDIIAGVGGTSEKLNDLYPERYPAKPVAEGKTRAQVLAELAEAQRSGELQASVGGSHSSQ